MTNVNTSEFLRAVDHAAGMNDRWMFVASLVTFGLFATFVMRYFVRQHERLIDDHKQARDTYQNSLRSMVAEQSAANQKLITTNDLPTHAEALGLETDVIEEAKRRFERAHGKQKALDANATLLQRLLVQELSI